MIYSALLLFRSMNMAVPAFSYSDAIQVVCHRVLNNRIVARRTIVNRFRRQCHKCCLKLRFLQSCCLGLQLAIFQPARYLANALLLMTVLLSEYHSSIPLEYLNTVLLSMILKYDLSVAIANQGVCYCVVAGNVFIQPTESTPTHASDNSLFKMLFSLEWYRCIAS